MKHRVLILRFSSLGDIVLISGAICVLQNAGVEVFVVTKAEFVDLLRSQSAVKDVFAYDKSRGESVAKEEVLAWAREKNISAVLDLHDSWRSWLLRRHLSLLGPLEVCRKQRWRELAILLGRMGAWVGWDAGGRAKAFQAAAYRLLDRLQINYVQHSLWTQLDAPSGPAPLVPKSSIVLVPGSAWAGKRWPETNFVKLAKELAATAPVLVLGGPKDSFCESIAVAAQEQNRESRALLGLALSQVEQILASARLVIGNDTGLLHIAEALGRPAIVLEGPTHPYLGFSAYRESTTLIGKDLVCRPCSKTGAICWRWGSRACMQISVDEVLAIAKRRLQETAC